MVDQQILVNSGNVSVSIANPGNERRFWSRFLFHSVSCIQSMSIFSHNITHSSTFTLLKGFWSYFRTLCKHILSSPIRPIMVDLENWTYKLSTGPFSIHRKNSSVENRLFGVESFYVRRIQRCRLQ